MVICLGQGADLHMAQLMPLPLTVSCFSKIQIGFTFLVPAHPCSPGKRAVKCVCVCVCVCVLLLRCWGELQHLLSNTNALVASKGMQAVKLCTNKIIQFLTGSAS